MMPPNRRQAALGALRVGIVLDSHNIVSAWMASVLDDLLGADIVEVVVVVVPAAGPEAGAGGSPGSWLFGKYAAWDAGRAVRGEDPLRTVDISSRLEGLPSAGTADLVGYELDALIWLAAGEPDISLRRAARYGVWRYGRREPDHFWEVYETNPVTRSTLQVLHTGADAPLIADETYSATEQGWSWQQNRRVPYARASTFVLRSLRQLHAKRSLEMLGNGAESVTAPGGAPNNLQMTAFLLRNAARTVSRRIRYANKESHWFVAYRSDQSKFVSNTEELDLRGFANVKAPEGHFYADPFVIEWRGRDYLFVEDYLFAKRRGCISVLEMSMTGVTSEAERVLDLPYHLSYPFVFEHGGELFMIPETLGAGRIELYRAKDGLTRWEFVKALRQDVQAVDTTLWIEDGRFYFFTNIAERGATVNDDLYLFHADDLLGEWQPHPLNPLVTDVRRSRGAGKLFWRNGKLIRPAQDCSVRYGYACQLNEVELLTPMEYRERPLRRIEPDWAPGLIGTHTINSNERFEVIDGQIYGKRYPG